MKEPLRGTQIRRCKHKLTKEEEAVVEAITKHEVGVEIQDQMLERLLNNKNLENMTQNNLNCPMVKEGTGSIEEERKDLIKRSLNASIVVKLGISLQNAMHQLKISPRGDKIQKQTWQKVKMLM